MALENVVGPLAETIPEVDLTTVLTSAQITTKRTDNPSNYSLRNQWFATADSALYRLENGEAVLYLGNADTNLIFRHPTEAIKQLHVGEYIPNEEDIESVVAKATRFQLSDLNLMILDSESAYFEINTSNYDNLNKAQKAFAEHVYGTGDDFTKNMQMLNKSDRKSVKVYILNPIYVKENAKDSALVRVCALNVSFGYEHFDATHGDVDNNEFTLLGVPKSVAERDKKNSEIRDAYTLILKNPIPDDSTAKSLLAKVNEFYQGK